MKSIGKIGRTALTGALAAAILLGGCGSSETTEGLASVADQTLRVSTEAPQRTTLSTESRYIGTVVQDSAVYVLPMVSAEVLETYYEVGDRVEEGDLLFTLDDTAARISLTQANATLSSAQAGLAATQAGYEAQQAGLTATQASAVASEASLEAQRLSAVGQLSSMGTTEQQLQMAVDNAGAQLTNARLSGGSAEEAYHYAEDLYYDAKDNDAPEATLDQLRLNMNASQNQLRMAVEAIGVAQEAYEYALQQQKDYLDYTRAASQAGIEAQLVGVDQQGQALAAQLEASEAQLEATGAQVNASRASVTQAAAVVANAQLALDYYTVESPVSGTITAKNVSEHNFATPSQAAYVIQGDVEGKVVFYVAERTMREMEVGNAAVFEHDGTEYNGRIISISGVIDSAQGLYKVEAQAEEAGVLPPNGSSISVRTVARQARDVLSVPADSVYYDGEQAFLYVVEGGVARRREIVTGLTDNERIEVKEGLLAEDAVIVSWSSNLKDGASVELQ